MATKTRESIIKQLRNFIVSFVSTETINDGRVNEAELSPEDKKLLKEMRKMDGVENIRKKYGATVDTTVAKANAERKGKATSKKEKSIDKE